MTCLAMLQQGVRTQTSPREQRRLVGRRPPWACNHPIHTLHHANFTASHTLPKKSMDGGPTLSRPSETIERHEFDVLSPSLRRSLRLSRTPFIIHIGRDHDGRWALEAVQQTMCGQHHSMRQFNPESHQYMDDIECSFDEFADLVQSGQAAARDIYWAYHDQQRKLSKQLASDSRFAQLERKLGLRAGRRVLSLWAGAAGHVETLHYDCSDNLHLVLSGRKRWLLFPPEALPRLRFVPWGAACRSVLRGEMLPVNRSGVGLDPACSLLEAADVEHAQPAPIQIELQPGEALFVPAGWAHQVEGIRDDTAGDDGAFIFSLNRFFPTPLRRLAPWPRLSGSGSSDRWAAFRAVVRIRTFHTWSNLCDTWHRLAGGPPDAESTTSTTRAKRVQEGGSKRST